MAALCRKCLKALPPDVDRCLHCRSVVDAPASNDLVLAGSAPKAGPGRPPEIIAALNGQVAAHERSLVQGSSDFGDLTFAQMAQDIAAVSLPSTSEAERVDFTTITLGRKGRNGDRRIGLKWPFRKPSAKRAPVSAGRRT